jgi:hypothetical protein
VLNKKGSSYKKLSEPKSILIFVNKNLKRNGYFFDEGFGFG